MNKLDNALLNILIKDSRTSFADIARQLNISRAHARTRVQALVESGVIEKFTAVVNPEKLGKGISTFVDLTVAPHAIEAVAQRLSATMEVVSLYIMSDLKSLHIHTLTAATKPSMPSCASTSSTTRKSSPWTARHC